MGTAVWVLHTASSWGCLHPDLLNPHSSPQSRAASWGDNPALHLDGDFTPPGLSLFVCKTGGGG